MNRLFFDALYLEGTNALKIIVSQGHGPGKTTVSATGAIEIYTLRDMQYRFSAHRRNYAAS